jgi:hypothetical protein
MTTNCSDLGFDAPLTLPRNKAIVYLMPQANGGLYSVSVGRYAYDVEPAEIEAALSAAAVKACDSTHESLPSIALLCGPFVWSDNAVPSKSFTVAI